VVDLVDTMGTYRKVMAEIVAVEGTVIMACTELGTTTVVAVAGAIITRV
jgi:hypothetical protein